MYNKPMYAIILLLLFSANTINAQNKEDELLHKISDECCVCMEEKIPLSDSITSQELEVNVGVCLLQVCSKYEEQLEEQGVSISDEKTFSLYAERIGERMSQKCEHFLSIIFSLMSDENSNTRKEAMANMSEDMEGAKAIANMTGTIKKLNSDVFLRIWLEHENGQDVFVCLGNLKDPSKIATIDNFLEKKVMITYEVISVYSPKDKAMIDMKKVFDIEFSEN